MNEPAVFFDRDNTLIVSDGYLGDPSQVVLVDGAAQAVAAIKRLGFATVVCSNQSGVARGMFDEEAVRAVNRRVDELLGHGNSGAVIDRHEYCPFHPQGSVEKYRLESDLRKPRPGMFHEAAKAMGIDLTRSWMIGDAPRDVEAGKAAGCRTILFRDASLSPSPASVGGNGVKADFVVASLAEAAEIVRTHRDDTVDDPEIKTKPAAQTPLTLEKLGDQILSELRHHKEHAGSEFSVTKLLAGIVQVIVLAALFYAYLSRNDLPEAQAVLTLAMVLQAMTIALLLMGHQR